VMSKQTLYHYSKEHYPQLLTLEQQKVLDPKVRQDAQDAARFRGDLFPYYQHVSFFLDPVPLDLVGEMFPKDHQAWVNGNELWQYSVDPTTMSIKGWVLTEAPLQNFLLDVLPWFDNRTYKRGYFKMLKLGRVLTQSEGSDLSGLVKCIDRYKGRTRAAYEKLKDSKDFEELKYKYAATVPHLMIYTDSPLTYQHAEQVTVGHTASLEARGVVEPPSAIW